MTNLQHLEDRALMGRVIARDPLAFEVLFIRHRGPAFGLALRLLADRGAAEEVVQEAFLVLWRRPEMYDAARTGVRSWLLSIVHHRAIDLLRARRLQLERRVGLDEVWEGLTSDDDTARTVVRAAEAQRVRTALALLPAEQRRAVELAYFGGMTYGEVARHLSLPAGTVKSRIRAALGKLRLALDGRPSRAAEGA